MLPFEAILLLGKPASNVSMIINIVGIESNSGKSKAWDGDTLAHED